jgi:hypothetical protein
VSTIDQAFIQPSELVLGAITGNTFVRGIPKPGAASPTGGSGVLAATGVGTCQNLFQYNSPGLLIEHDIYSYAIATAVFLDNSVAFSSTPQIVVELALLLNGRVALTATANPVPAVFFSGQWAIANAIFNADLVNVLPVRTSDQLSIRLGVSSSLAADSTSNVAIVGANLDNSGDVIAAESTLTYSTRVLTR